MGLSGYHALSPQYAAAMAVCTRRTVSSLCGVVMAVTVLDLRLRQSSRLGRSCVVGLLLSLYCDVKSVENGGLGRGLYLPGLVTLIQKAVAWPFAS
jgi:hypothetical protein